MKKYMFILVAVFSVVFVTSGIFYACQKESGAVTEVTKDSGIRIQKECIVIVQTASGYKGSGSGQDKTCAPANGTCWLWFRSELEPESDGWWIIGSCPTAIVTKEDNDGSSSNLITLNYPYQYNDMSKLNELFLMTEGLLVIEEAIIEEGDSYLLEIINAPATSFSSCRIPAGSYPISIDTDGIKVTLPVIVE
jgi:hypothetical protein